MDEHQIQAVKGAANVGAVGVVIGALLDAVPHLAAIASLIWMCLQIYEHKAVQRWIAKLRKKKDAA